jgi:MEMO1 family protein
MQKEKSNNKLPDRQAAVAGKFYPSMDIELMDELIELFSKAKKLTRDQKIIPEHIRAVITPHAGYVFSGVVAAAAFLHLKKRDDIHRVFLIGSSHHVWFEGASIYYESHYITPLGKVKVDSILAKKMLSACSFLNYHPEAHSNEHCLEVQLPFLQYILPSTFKIIPIIIGSQSKETPCKLAEMLKPYFTQNNLFVVSTDFSHYPEYYDAVKIDQLTVEAICSNNPDQFIHQVNENEKKQIKNLATSICGWSSVLTLLYLTSSMRELRYNPILYQNSGDIALYGDKSRVVGYQSIVIDLNMDPKHSTISLSTDEKKILLNHARESIINNIKPTTTKTDGEKSLPHALLAHFGAFVSVYIDNNLRGCIGRMESDESIYSTIEKMSIASSADDSRFSPIRAHEIEKMSIEISILSPLRKISSISEIIPGKHGILIRKDFRSGTFLPQVADKTGWNTEEMLSQCSDRKAGLGPDGWRDAEIFIYEAEVFSDKYY